AIAGTLALGFEPNITAATFIVGGSQFTDIIATSDESGAVRLREERMKAFKYKNLDEYKSAVKKNVWVEPAQFITPRESLKSFVISASADTTVLTKYQLDLVKQLHADKHIHLLGDHIQVVKNTFWNHRQKIVNYFKKNLEVKNENKK
ncbi:MAG: hypothetical protein KDD34_06220, partial [Bdellovibrionales bacterium]|nr:hypothetical protein [Bdellovibrionales bacterium]